MEITMKRFVMALALLMMTAPALANDGGVAAITVDQIKMKELDSNHELKRKIANPNFEITLSGGEAKKLQQILPSMISVITAMQPELKKQYDETFKSLGIMSNASNGVTAKLMGITCSDGEVVSGSDGKMAIRKNGKTTCTISINTGLQADSFGETQVFEPKVCR